MSSKTPTGMEVIPFLDKSRCEDTEAQEPWRVRALSGPLLKTHPPNLTVHACAPGGREKMMAAAG